MELRYELGRRGEMAVRATDSSATKAQLSGCETSECRSTPVIGLTAIWVERLHRNRLPFFQAFEVVKKSKLMVPHHLLCKRCAAGGRE
jgi:hypothetical protein